MRVVYEPKTFDPAFHRPLSVDASDRERFGADLVFVGTYERRRAKSCLALARAGFDVRVFGNGWERLRGAHPDLRVEGRGVGGEDYVRTLCASTIALGFLREASRDEHTDRSVEIPACGAFMLAERSGEHLALFREHREAAYFGDDDELVAQARRYLADDAARAEIAAAGRRRCLELGYDHAAACRRMIAAATGAPHRSEVDDTTSFRPSARRSVA
ncbi:MAG: glycosyltransferase [Planctomycetota bacterium]